MISKQFDDVATVELGGGVPIPQLGFGTFQIWPYEAQQAVEDALALGYRHIDTAAAYCNEGQVGAALAGDRHGGQDVRHHQAPQWRPGRR